MKKIITLSLLMVILFSSVIVNNALAYSATDEEFKFEKDVYEFVGEGDSATLSMKLPYGFDMGDVSFYSDDESVAKVEVIELEKVYCLLEAKGIGETNIYANIEGTSYWTTCTVKIENPINISVEENGVGATLRIKSENSLNFSTDTIQAVEILVEPLNNPENAKWIRLGEGIIGEALNKEYTYYIEENAKVTVRQIIWWTNMSYNGIISELASNSITVDNIEPISTIGANLYIYQEDRIDTVTVGDTLQLKVGLVEIPTDKIITWKSYDEDVAVVDDSGKVYTFREGTVKFEATVTVNNRVYRDIFALNVTEESKENSFLGIEIIPIYSNLISFFL